MTYNYPHLNEIYRRSLAENFNLPCLSDYNTKEELSYGQFAERLARTHILLEKAGVRPGDKVALLGKNNVNWVVAFFATLTYGAVVVPILVEFNPRDAQHIVNHSDAVLLFVSDAVWEAVEWDRMPQLKAAMSLDSRRVLAQREGTDMEAIVAGIDAEMKARYPQGFRPDDVWARPMADDDLALINYTSGTTGFSKGVMLSHGNLWGNVVFGIESRLHYRGSRALSFLPLAHAYGCAFDMLVPMAVGTHITLLGRTPTPRILLKALAEVKPSLIVCVPLILEKIYRRMIVPVITSRPMRWALMVPFMDHAIYPRIRRKLVEAFGGEFEEVIIGGAPLNQEVEDFLRTIRFPFTVGYGMTECGPLISYTPWRRFVPTSAGELLPGLMDGKILAKEGEKLGEIMVKGKNVMQGYYKNPDATEAVLEEDGWLHTGDMGRLGGEENRTIFIRGRYKTMILTATGQNVYPEEIESKLNNMPYVAESLVVERNGHLEALVYPDSEQTDQAGIDNEGLVAAMEENRTELNKLVAPYERIERIELRDEEFEKTPKRSIKRYLYS